MTVSQETAKKIENIEGKTWAINNKQIVIILIAVIGAAFNAGTYWTNKNNTTDGRFTRIENMITLLNLKDSIRIQAIDYKIGNNHAESAHRFEIIEKKLSVKIVKPVNKPLSLVQNIPAAKGYTQVKTNGRIAYIPIF